MSAVGARFNAFLKWDEGSGRLALVAGMAVVFWIFAFALLFAEDASGALRVWLDSPTFNHCFLILPLCLFLVWHRRGQLGAVRIEPDWRGLAVIVAAGVAWNAALLANVLEARQFAVLTMVQGALLCTLGGSAYRKLLAPFLYLYFLVPSGAWLIPALQSFTAAFAVAGLHLLHIPVFSNGAIIEIPAGRFAVAEACAGLRFLVASVAFGVFFAIVTYRSRAKRAAFILISATVPVIANGLRALGLIAAAEWIGNPAAALADHLIYGWVFFSLVLIALIALGEMFADGRSEDTKPNISAPRQFPIRRVPALLSVVLCLLCAGLAPAVAAWLQAGESMRVPNIAPRVASPWVEVASQTDWRPRIEGASRNFAQSFVRGGARIDRFVAIYGETNGRQNVVRSNDRDADERKWTFARSCDAVLRSRGRNLSVRLSEWTRGLQHRSVWSFYVVDGRVVSNPLVAKWMQLESYVTGNRCLSAYFGFSMLHGEDHIDPAVPANAIASTEDFRRYLCRATRGR